MTEKTRQTNQQKEISKASLTWSPSRFVGVLRLLPRLRNTRFHDGLRDVRTWREGVLPLKQRRSNETNQYHPAQQSPHENDWLPWNKNQHGRTSGDKERLTTPVIILRKTQTLFVNIVLVVTMRECSARDSEHCWNVASEHANRKSHPFQAWLAQGEKIRTRRDAGEIDASPQDHNVIFEFSRGARAEQFSTARIEQRYIVRPLVASDWQLQVQTPCVTRNL